MKKNILFSMPMQKSETFQDRLENYKNDLFPGHFLFGAPELENLGYKVIYSCPDDPSKTTGILSYFISMIKYTIYLLREGRSFNIIYSPYPNSLDFVIFLRAIKIYPKKIVINQQCAIEKKRGFFDYFLRQYVYFKGVDKLIFFDNKSANDSYKTGLVSKDKIYIENWGPDVEQYQRILDKSEARKISRKISFISTGRDSRDFELMFEAFKDLEVPFEFYLMDKNLVEKYKDKSTNINVRYLETSKDSPHVAMNALINSDVSVIICNPTRPTCNGYTALCEAMGLGKPVILTKNPFMPIDVEKERIGLTVPSGDVEALRKSILTFSNNPQMVKEYGYNARKLAEEKWNSNVLAKQLDNLFQNI